MREGRRRRGEEMGGRGGWKKKERAVSIVGGGCECGRIRYSPGWGRGIVQELCSVFFYTLYDLLMTAYSWSI